MKLSAQLADSKQPEEAFIGDAMKMIGMGKIKYDDLSDNAKKQAQKLANASDETIDMLLEDLSAIFNSFKVRLDKKTVSTTILDCIVINGNAWQIAFDLDSNEVLKPTELVDRIYMLVSRSQMGFEANVVFGLSDAKRYGVTMTKTVNAKPLRKSIKKARDFMSKLIRL